MQFLKRNIILIIVAILLVAGALAALFHNSGNASTNICNNKTGVTHQVVIQNSQVQPQRTYGKLCDKMTITNRDNIQRLIAFGPHEHHTPYDGVTERLLSQNQSLTVTLNQAGNFRFHDHIHDVVQGYFTVSK